MRTFNSHFHFDVIFFPIKSKILKSSEWDTPPRLLRGVTTFLIYHDLFLDPPLIKSLVRGNTFPRVTLCFNPCPYYFFILQEGVLVTRAFA